MIILFIISFSSFCYQVLAAKAAYLYLQDDNLAFAIASTLLFFGMARGCRGYLRIHRTLNSVVPNYYLVSNELSVVICAALLGFYLSSVPFLMGTLQFYFPTQGTDQLQVATALPGFLLLYFLGFYLGRELSLAYNFIESREKEKTSPQVNKIGFAISWTYLGALFASLICVFWFFKQINPIQFISLPIILNLILAIYFLKIAIPEIKKYKKVLIAAKTLISIGLAIYFALLGDHIYEKSKSILYNVSRTDQKASLLEYLESMQKNIQIKSFASQFQVADWVTYFNQPSFSRLYLDGAFQFDSFDQSGYHDPFWQGGLYFSNFTPKKILIMGGGDGLLAATLYKDAKTKNDFDLTLVELDPMIPQLAYENWHILERNVLHYLKLQLGDAFDFIRTHHNEWQAIFLDFPDPRSADLSKLYSVEFYTMLRKNLSRNGFIVLDYPAKNSLNIIYSTLRAAGFINIIIYGSGNTFVYADQKIRSENELQSLKNQSLFKVWPATHFDPSQVNSIFDLRLPEEQSFQVFQAWWSK